MLKSRRFVKKTKKGAVVTVNREHYLRTDIACGLRHCQRGCTAPSGAPQPLLADKPALVPDTNICLHNADFLEHASITNVILLSTVLEEVKHRNMAVYSRVRAMIDNKKKHFYVFVNEHCKATFVEQQPGESINDRNDRAIRVAAKWYAKHTSANTEQPSAANTAGASGAASASSMAEDETAMPIILLTNDRANLEKARAEGIDACTATEFAKQYGHTELLDLIAQSEQESREGGQDSEMLGTMGSPFPAHLPLSVLQRGVQSGKLLQGVFHASRENSRQGFVSVRGSDMRVLVKGGNMNRAVEGDVVAVELLSKEEWAQPEEEVDVEDARTLLEGGHLEDEPDAANEPSRAQPTAKVVGIVKRNWRPYCGMIKPPTDPKASRVLFFPQDRSVPPVRIVTRQLQTLLGQRIIVSIDSWPADSRYPQGHFVRLLGPAGDAATETEVVLLEHDVPYEPFSQSVLDCLPKLPWGITKEDLATRRDLRHLNICSIDPPGCTDIDDALHCRVLEKGKLYEVGVHIADVTHFIRPGTAVDLEAAKRGTTVYLTNRRIDMVPPLLSSNLCSLRGNEERLAFSVIWKLDENAEIVDVDFCKSIICSKAAFEYSEAQMRIDDKNDKSPLIKGVRALNKLAKKLRQRRLDAGALMLASPEVRFSLESESHDPVDVELKQLHETNSLVEEFMLLANVTVARKIYKHFSDCAMLRRHPTPPTSYFEPLLLAAKSAGVELDTSTSKALALTLEEAGDQQHKYFNTLLRILATRCMLPAAYFSSGLYTPDEFRHYGLASPIYTHFTSPIRRYADVIVHRLLAAAIGVDSSYPELLDKDAIAALADNLNHRNRMAQHASRASTDLHCQLFFKDRVQDEEAFVVRVRKNAISVLVPRYGLEGPVYLQPRESSGSSAAAGQTILFDPENACVTVGDGPKAVKFKVFDRVIVQVKVEESTMQHRRIVMHLVEPVVPGLSVEAQPEKHQAKKARK